MGYATMAPMAPGSAYAIPDGPESTVPGLAMEGTFHRVLVMGPVTKSQGLAHASTAQCSDIGAVEIARHAIRFTYHRTARFLVQFP
jgi:hypothetical protein